MFLKKSGNFLSNQTHNFIPEKCLAHPEIENLFTTTEFPVNHGSTVSVSCDSGYKLVGDKVITCVRDKQFSYGIEPHCQQRELWTKYLDE